MAYLSHKWDFKASGIKVLSNSLSTWLNNQVVLIEEQVRALNPVQLGLGVIDD
jgi:hypothetical protein